MRQGFSTPVGLSECRTKPGGTPPQENSFFVEQASCLFLRFTVGWGRVVDGDLPLGGAGFRDYSC
ncbi:hypothetical protein QUA43_04240 [Microcoleus sp. N9_B4]